MKKILLILCLSVVLAGCDGRAGQIDVVIEDISEEKVDDHVTFRGEVGVLGSRVSSLTIEDVQVSFINSLDEEMKTVQIGTIRNTSFRREFSANLSEPPQRVLIETGAINTDGNVVLQGLRRNETGGYEYFEQEQ